MSRLCSSTSILRVVLRKLLNIYEGMKKLALEYDQKIIDELVVQEKNHLKQLSNLKQGL